MIGEIKPKKALRSWTGVLFAALMVAGGIYVVGRTLAVTPIVGDVNKDGKITILDISLMLTAWGTADVDADLNHSGNVDIFDISLLLNAWGTQVATATPTPSPSRTPTPQPQPARFGFAAHILSQSDPAAYLQLAKSANATTVRDDFSWSGIEPQKGVFNWTNSDRKMTLTAQLGIHMLIIADYSPTWASSCPTDIEPSKCGPVNAADYANYVGNLAKRYGKGGAFWAANPTVPYTEISGIEIWNEPNLQHFWHNPDGGRYAAIVKAAYPAIKNADPSITVLAGAMSPASYTAADRVSAITFLEQMYAAGAKGSFDALAYHPYNYLHGKTADVMLALSPTSGWSRMAETSPSLRSVMVDSGDGAKKIWATELGGPTNTIGITEAEQGRLAQLATERWKTYPWAGNYYWYDVRDDCTDVTNRECFFGVVRRDNSLKPSYSALQSAYK